MWRELSRRLEGRLIVLEPIREEELRMHFGQRSAGEMEEPQKVSRGTARMSLGNVGRNGD